MSSAFELSAKNLSNQHCRAVRTNALQLLKANRFLSAWEGRLLMEHNFSAVPLDVLDLIVEQREPFETALNLSTKVWWQRPPIAGAHVVQLLRPVAPADRLDRLDTMQCEQSPDPRNDPGALVDKIVALTHDASRIFFLGRRHIDNPANAPVTGEIGLQDTDHRFGIDAIGLHALAPPRHEEAGGIKNICVHVVRPQQSRKPEAIVADLKTQAGDCARADALALRL